MVHGLLSILNRQIAYHTTNFQWSNLRYLVVIHRGRWVQYISLQVSSNEPISLSTSKSRLVWPTRWHPAVVHQSWFLSFGWPWYDVILNDSWMGMSSLSKLIHIKTTKKMFSIERCYVNVSQTLLGCDLICGPLAIDKVILRCTKFVLTWIGTDLGRNALDWSVCCTYHIYPEPQTTFFLQRTQSHVGVCTLHSARALRRLGMEQFMVHT